MIARRLSETKHAGEARLVTWDSVSRLDNRLRVLLDYARRQAREYDGEPGDWMNRLWYGPGKIKSKLSKLVGHSRVAPEQAGPVSLDLQRLYGSDAYDAAYRHLVDQMDSIIVG